MVTITILKKLAQKSGDLVVIPRKEYEKFLMIFKTLPKSQWWFWTKDWQKMEQEADRDISEGKIGKPYTNIKELKKALAALKE